MSQSKTIQIHLPTAEVDGVRIADLSNSMARVYVVPRTKLDFLLTRRDLTSPSLYMLFDDERTSVYIGESENFIKRIKDHESKKGFWQIAVICIAAGQGLDKADVKFLESYSVQKAIEVSRFEVQNRTNPNKNNLHEFKLATVLDYFNDIELLISSLGFNLFEPVKSDTPDDPKKLNNSERLTREYDTIIGPASGNGRVEAFEKKSAWWAVRISESNLHKFKYVGLYEAAPVSAIRYYAKITEIKPFEDKPGKYIIHHDGNIHKLDNPIVVGSHPELSLYGPRYFKLDDILSSKSMAELTDRTFGSDYSSR